MEGHASLSTALVNVYHKHLIYTTYIERTPRISNIYHAHYAEHIPRIPNQYHVYLTVNIHYLLNMHNVYSTYTMYTQHKPHIANVHHVNRFVIKVDFSNIKVYFTADFKS